MNSITLIGNLVSDPIIKTTKSGRAMAMFNVACNETVTDPNSGEIRQKANFINCTAWGKLAQYVSQYLNKGKRAIVVGKYTSWSRDNGDGTREYGNNITVQDVAVSAYSVVSRSGNGQWGGKQQGSGFQNGNNSQEPPPSGFDQFGPAESEDVPF